jgi:hypothetical protein
VPVVSGAAKPAAAPLAPTEVSKSGTSVIKAAPPKETSRITVKPSLPATAKTGTGPASIPTVKPGVAVPVAAGAAAVAAVKAGEARPKAATAGAPITKPVVYQESESTLLTTVAAGVLALLTWGTAAVLCYYSLLI